MKSPFKLKEAVGENMNPGKLKRKATILVSRHLGTKVLVRRTIL